MIAWEYGADDFRFHQECISFLFTWRFYPGYDKVKLILGKLVTY